MARFTGKTVIITGGSRGLGRAFAERLGHEGASVLITGRTQTDLDKAVADLVGRGINTLSVTGDVTDHSVLDRVVELAMDKWGRIDVLVNNAGLDDTAAFLEIEQKNWDYIIAVMLTAPFALAQRCAREMVKAGSGSIVNIASVLGHVADGPYASYGAAKSGLIGLTKWIAVELAPKGVRCNSLSPGYVVTPLVEESLGSLLPYFKSDFVRVPLRRMLTLEEVAAACAFLASDEASGVNGMDFVIDGGTLADGFIMPVADMLAKVTPPRDDARLDLGTDTSLSPAGS
jgi:NAD(P)-dependent dehydrogenase (short-subunit alcohol dehydrogenase family)